MFSSLVRAADENENRCDCQHRSSGPHVHVRFLPLGGKQIGLVAGEQASQWSYRSIGQDGDSGSIRAVLDIGQRGSVAESASFFAAACLASEGDRGLCENALLNADGHGPSSAPGALHQQVGRFEHREAPQLRHPQANWPKIDLFHLGAGLFRASPVSPGGEFVAATTHAAFRRVRRSRRRPRSASWHRRRLPGSSRRVCVDAIGANEAPTATSSPAEPMDPVLVQSGRSAWR